VSKSATTFACSKILGFGHTENQEQRHGKSKAETRKIKSRAHLHAETAPLGRNKRPWPPVVMWSEEVV